MFQLLLLYTVQFSRSVMFNSCNPMDCSMPGFTVNHQLLELAQTHVRQISDAIQQSHPLSSPISLPFRNLCHIQEVFGWWPLLSGSSVSILLWSVSLKLILSYRFQLLPSNSEFILFIKENHMGKILHSNSEIRLLKANEQMVILP